MMNRKPSRPAPNTCCIIGRRRGFTLIELLVVISILTMVASLLLPALIKAKIAAHRTYCLNNLKQFGVASIMYNDDLGHLPRASNPSTDSPKYQRWTKAMTLAGYFDAKTPGGYDGADGEMFLCPAKKGLITRKARINAHFASDYGMNQTFCYNKFSRLADIRNTSRVYYMLDRIATWNSTKNWWEPLPGFFETVNRSMSVYDPDAHDGRTNALFFDGHTTSPPGPEPNALYDNKWVNGANRIYTPWGDWNK